MHGALKWLRQGSGIDRWVVSAAVLVVLSNALFYLTGWLPHVLNPEGEFRPASGYWLLPVLISILLLLCAGVQWQRVARKLSGRPALAAGVLGALLLFMSADDFLALHEKLENLTHVDWLYWYLPIMSVGALAVLVVFRFSRSSSSTRQFRLLLLGGAVSWILAQVLEAIESFWHDARLYASELVIPEESLETVGAAAFALAALSLARNLPLSRTSGDEPPGGPWSSRVSLPPFTVERRRA